MENINQHWFKNATRQSISIDCEVLIGGWIEKYNASIQSLRDHMERIPSELNSMVDCLHSKLSDSRVEPFPQRFVRISWRLIYI